MYESLKVTMKRLSNKILFPWIIISNIYLWKTNEMKIKSTYHRDSGVHRQLNIKTLKKKNNMNVMNLWKS